MYSHLSVFFRERKFVAIGFVFSINALLFAFWITRIPEVKITLGLSDGRLGAALFFMPIGALLAMLSVSALVQRFGAGKVTIGTGVLYIACIFLPFISNSFWMLAGSLFFVGLTSGAMDIAMNAVASILEKDHKTDIMSSCHGFFSLGGMIGAGVGSLLIALSVSGVLQILVGMGLMLLLLLFVAKPAIYNIKEARSTEESHFALPGKALFGLAIVAFCSMQGEGGVADWSAVYMGQIVQAEEYMWGLAFTGFSMSMTLVRFAGDSIVARVGSQRVILLASLVVVVGLVLVLPATGWLSIAGFTISGISYALLVPVVFAEAGRQPVVSPSRGIAAVATVGYFGFLVGPVLIGGIAEWFGLKTGFIYLMVFTLLALIAFRVIERK
ncbi:MAG: MFS transporter [Rhodothermales bacterium]